MEFELEIERCLNLIYFLRENVVTGTLPAAPFFSPRIFSGWVFSPPVFFPIVVFFRRLYPARSFLLLFVDKTIKLEKKNCETTGHIPIDDTVQNIFDFFLFLY